MTFPTRESVSYNNGISASGGGDPITLLDYPVSIAENDLLILIAGARAAAIGDFPGAGWNSFGNSTATLTDMRCFWKKALGTESGTTISFVSFASPGDLEWSGIIYRFTGAADPDTQPPEAAMSFQDSDTSTKTSPSLTPTGGAKDYTWITAFVHRDQGTISGYPTNYINNVYNLENAYASMSGYADRELNASSEDPGDFTTSLSADYSACTIAIHPAGAGGLSVPEIITMRRKTNNPLINM